jgi:hypothetical protein
MELEILLADDQDGKGPVCSTAQLGVYSPETIGIHRDIRITRFSNPAEYLDADFEEKPYVYALVAIMRNDADYDLDAGQHPYLPLVERLCELGIPIFVYTDYVPSTITEELGPKADSVRFYRTPQAEEIAETLWELLVEAYGGPDAVEDATRAYIEELDDNHRQWTQHNALTWRDYTVPYARQPPINPKRA